MNKKILIPVAFSSILLTALGFNREAKSCIADGAIVLDVEKIQALSHKDGVVVSMAQPDIQKYWDSNVNDINNLKNLYEMNNDISSFANNANNHDYVRALYDRWDDFKPTNNVLSWKSNVKATSYDITVSLNADLTKSVYEEKGLTEQFFEIKNPYSNTHYFWQVTAHTNGGEVKSSIFDFKTSDFKRTVNVPTVSNTRDIGGFSGALGEMKQGLIYRSGRLDDVTEIGVSTLNELGIQTDLDLRKNGEGLKNPAKLPNYYLRTIIQYSPGFSKTNRESMIEAVKVFCEPSNYPVIFHCAVGRDRTGTLAMLLQALAGASKDYIIHDYFTSMWSVTGAYDKGLSDLNLAPVNETLSFIESFGNSLMSGAENFLRKDESNIGLTDEEIQKIRDIWSGKIDVEHEIKPFKASENYEGKAFVNVKALGHKDTSMFVDKGVVIPAPYELSSGLGWFTKEGSFSFANAIKDNTYIYADYVSSYIVTIHFIGQNKEDVVLNVKSGDVVKFASYEVDGYNMLVLSDTGKEITRLEVNRNASINVIYTKK